MLNKFQQLPSNVKFSILFLLTTFLALLCFIPALAISLVATIGVMYSVIALGNYWIEHQ
jgi:hypothetical protein